MKNFQDLVKKHNDTRGTSAASDPTYILKLIAKKHYNDKKHKKIEGGLIPLLPIGLSILGSLAGKVISEIYDNVKEKIQGKGYRTNMNHKTIEHKRKFLNQVISNY